MGDKAPNELGSLSMKLIARCLFIRGGPAAAATGALVTAHLLPALLRSQVILGGSEGPTAWTLKQLWCLIACIQKDSALVQLLDSRTPEVLRRLLEEDPEVVRTVVETSTLDGFGDSVTYTGPLLQFGLCKEWDYTVLMVADPLTRLLDLADVEHEERQESYVQPVIGALFQLESAADPMLPSAGRGLDPEHGITLAQLRPAVVNLMNAVHALTPLSMEAVGARLRLPQIGCSHPGCRNMAGVSEALLEVKRCSGCMRAQYCSPACQRAAWKQHKTAFRAQAARLASSGAIIVDRS